MKDLPRNNNFPGYSMTLAVLVTGGTGFLGTFIVDAIIDRHPEWSVTVFDLNLPSSPRPNVSYRSGDVRNPDDVNETISETKPSIIVHTAGLVPNLAHRFSRSLESQVRSVNVDGTRNMLTTAQNHSVRAFIWTGSCCAVTDNLKYSYRNIDETHPTYRNSLIYGSSKAIAESLVLAANSPSLATCVLRPSVLFGPGDYQLIPSIHACIAKHETPYIIGTGTNLWDVTYVGNIADAHVLAAENLLTTRTAAGEAIFIANDEPIPFRDLCIEIWKNFGHYPPFEIRIPESIATFAGFLTESITYLTNTPTTLSRGSVRDACAIRYCSGAKARKLLGYKPRVGIEEGIRISCQEYAKRLEAEGKVFAGRRGGAEARGVGLGGLGGVLGAKSRAD